MGLYRPVFTLLALTWCSAAVAGPIGVNIQVTTRQTHGPLQTGLLDLTFNTQGDLQLDPGGRVDLGSAHFGFYGGPGSWPIPYYGTRDTFGVDITVTDTASGQAATFQISGATVDEWMQQVDGSWVNRYHSLQTGRYWWWNAPLIYRETLGDHLYVLYVRRTRKKRLRASPCTWTPLPASSPPSHRVCYSARSLSSRSAFGPFADERGLQRGRRFPDAQPRPQ